MEHAYSVDVYPGVAFEFVGPETVPDEDTEWSGIKVETGRLVMVMIGDDRKMTFDPEQVKALSEDDYCSECGQIGHSAEFRAEHNQ